MCCMIYIQTCMPVNMGACARTHTHDHPYDHRQRLLNSFPMNDPRHSLRILLSKQSLPIYQYRLRAETCFLSFILSTLQIRSSKEVPKKLQRSNSQSETKYGLVKNQTLCLMLVYNTVPIWNVSHTHSLPNPTIT